MKIINTTFPHNIIPSYWFTETVRIIEAIIEDNSTRDIEPNAFYTPAFSKAMLLNLHMPLEILRNDSLNGLPRLRQLTLLRTKLYVVETKLCNSALLSSLAVYDSDFKPTRIVTLLNAFSIRPDKTYSIKIERNNLFRKITKDLFSKFTNLSSLMLQQNKISEIESGSFNAFGKTLKTISLRENLLKTLPDHLFPQEFLVDRSRILKYLALQPNPWHCDCDLNYFKMIQIVYSKRFIVKPLCYTPLNLRGKRILDVDLCNQNNSDQTIKEIEVAINCQSERGLSSIIKLHVNKLVQISVLSSRELKIRMKFISPIYALILLEKTSLKNGTFSITKCRTTEKNKTFNLVRTIQTNHLYEFCLVMMLENNISPLNCVLYRGVQSKAAEVWLHKDVKLFLPIVAIFVCILTTFVSAGVVIMTWKYLRRRRSGLALMVHFQENRMFSEKFVSLILNCIL